VSKNNSSKVMARRETAGLTF